MTEMAPPEAVVHLQTSLDVLFDTSEHGMVPAVTNNVDETAFRANCYYVTAV